MGNTSVRGGVVRGFEHPAAFWAGTSACPVGVLGGRRAVVTRCVLIAAALAGFAVAGDSPVRDRLLVTALVVPGLLPAGPTVSGLMVTGLMVTGLTVTGSMVMPPAGTGTPAAVAVVLIPAFRWIGAETRGSALEAIAGEERAAEPV